MDTIVRRIPLVLPARHDTLLLRSCCAPCSGEAMPASGVDYTTAFPLDQG